LPFRGDEEPADGLPAAAVLAKSVWQAAGNALKSRDAESRASRGDTAYAGPHGPGDWSA